MIKLTRNAKVKYLLFISVFVLNSFVQRIHIPFIWYGDAIGILCPFVYISLLVVWGISISNKVVDDKLKVLFSWVNGLMIFWIFIRILRYNLFNDVWANQLLWYLYYVPLTLIPLLIFYSSLFINNPKKVNRLGKWSYLIVLNILLILLVLTNNIHHLAFSFLDPVNYNFHYKYGIVYYLCLSWFVVFMVLSIVLCFFRSKGSSKRRYLWIQLIWLFIAGLYSIYYIKGRDLFNGYIIQLPEAYCFIFVGFIETSFQAGLFPSNSLYPQLFREGNIKAVIENDKHERLYSSKSADQFTLEQLKTADKTGTKLDNNYMIHSKVIENGHLYWVDDYTSLVEMNDELTEIKLELQGEKDLLIAENELKHKQLAVEAKNKLYNRIDELLRPELLKVIQIVEDTPKDSEYYNQALALASFYLAYIKRKSNLIILSQNNPRLSSNELVLSIKESLNQLSSFGISASVANIGEEMLNQDIVIAFYDFFQKVVEKVLEKTTAIFVSVSITDKTQEIRLQIENGDSLCLENEFNLKEYVLKEEKDDDTLVVTFIHKKEVS